jgi:hypothetical protein
MLEILHLASLVHDDVIDEAPLRRGEAPSHHSSARGPPFVRRLSFLPVLFHGQRNHGPLPREVQGRLLAMTPFVSGNSLSFSTTSTTI